LKAVGGLALTVFFLLPAKMILYCNAIKLTWSFSIRIPTYSIERALLNLISVIIVNWNGKEFIGECLNELNKQTCRDFSIIIVDNAADDGSLELVQNIYPEVKTIALPENLGFAAANNIAIKSVNTEYLEHIRKRTVASPLNPQASSQLPLLKRGGLTPPKEAS